MNRLWYASLSFLLVFCLALLFPTGAQAQTGEYSYARVVRLSAVQGDVQIARPDSQAWEPANPGLPLQQGYSIGTGNGRAVIEFENGTMGYLAENSVLQFTELALADGGRITRLTLTEGTATFYAKVTTSDTFVILTPAVQASITDRARFRVDTSPEASTVSVESGEVQVNSSAGPASVSAGNALSFRQSDPDNVTIARSAEADDWDRWVSGHLDVVTSRGSGSSGTLQYGSGTTSSWWYPSYYGFGAGYGWGSPWGCSPWYWGPASWNCASFYDPFNSWWYSPWWFWRPVIFVPVRPVRPVVPSIGPPPTTGTGGRPTPIRPPIGVRPRPTVAGQFREGDASLLRPMSGAAPVVPNTDARVGAALGNPPRAGAPSSIVFDPRERKFVNSPAPPVRGAPLPPRLFGDAGVRAETPGATPPAPAARAPSAVRPSASAPVPSAPPARVSAPPPPRPAPAPPRASSPRPSSGGSSRPAPRMESPRAPAPRMTSPRVSPPSPRPR